MGEPAGKPLTQDRSPLDEHPELAQAERDEEWALLVLVAWLALLVFILLVLVFSPWPWGAVVGLVVWAFGARGVFKDFSAAVARTEQLRGRSTDTSGAA